MIKQVYVVSTRGRRTGKLYVKRHAAKKLAEHYASFAHNAPVKILTFECNLVYEEEIRNDTKRVY